MNKDSDVGLLIRQRRVDLRITLKEVADFCGVSESTVSRWETGKIASVKRAQLYQLSQILRISMDSLMGIGDGKDIVPAETLLKREKIQKLVEKCSDEQLDEVEKFIKMFVLK